MIRFLYVSVFLWSMSIFSQEKTRTITLENTSLSDAILVIEKQYNVKFSYIDALLEGKKVSVKVTPNTTLKQLLATLQQQTKLKFTSTSDNYITISMFKKSDTVFICGYILDEEQKSLDDIDIFIKSIKVNLTTDEKGYFEYAQAPYSSPILISGPGFRQKVVSTGFFYSKNCSKVQMTYSQEEQLDEVLIQEYLTKGITQNKKVISINLKDVDALPGRTEPDILQSVQLTPGVNNPFETASGLFVRGSTPHQNLVLWNGIKTYQQGHFFGMLSAFNPYVAKEVDFYKSGVSARYGDRIAGVIDIKSEDKVADAFTGGAGFNMINADAVLNTPIIRDKLSIQVSGRRSFTDLFQTFTYKQFSDRVFQNTKISENTPLDQERNDFYYADYNANLIYTPVENQKIEINTVYSKNNLDFRRSNTSESFNDNLITENEGYNLKWKGSFSDKLSMDVNGYYTKYLLDYQFITRDPNTIIETESKKNSVEDYGGKLHVEYKISEYQELSSGYQYSKNNTKYAFVTTTPSYELTLDQDDRFLNTHSFYTEYAFENPKNFYISAGLRFNHYTELIKNFIEPRVFVQKHLSRYWEINSSVEYRSQASSQIQESVISDLSLENQVWTLANDEEFPILSSYQITFGSSFRKQKWFLDIGSYYKRINDITSLTAGFLNPVSNSYQNGESRVYGLDFFLKKRFNKYKTWVSYSYINTRNKFENINNNDFFPGNWNIEHTLKWSHFYKISNFQFTLGWLWHTGKAFTNALEVNTDDSGFVVIEFDDINGNNLPVYHRLDFSALYDFKMNNNSNIKYRLGLSVLNLYNRRNLLNREFRTTNSFNNRIINNDIFSLGITPNISFRVFW